MKSPTGSCLWPRIHPLTRPAPARPHWLSRGAPNSPPHRLTARPAWQPICRGWGEHLGSFCVGGGILCPIGTGFFADLDESMTRTDLCQPAYSLRTDWSAQFETDNNGWRRWTQTLPAADNEEALILAAVQHLSTCGACWRPSFPTELAEIEAFLELAEQSMTPLPKRTSGTSLSFGSQPSTECACRHLGERGRILVDRVKPKFLLARLDDDWATYRDWKSQAPVGSSPTDRPAAPNRKRKDDPISQRAVRVARRSDVDSRPNGRDLLISADVARGRLCRPDGPDGRGCAPYGWQAPIAPFGAGATR